jgi:hypothetical protein
MTTRSNLPGRWLVVAGLRRWAEGSATDEAAVELLVSLGTRLTHRNCPWIRPCRRSGWFWLDPDQLRRFPRRLTAHERRVLALVVALLTDQTGTPAGSVVVGRAA